MSSNNAVFGRARRQFHRMHQKLGSSPLINWFLGALVLLLWLCGTVVQIQTSEYLAQGASQQVAGVAWGILWQPVEMVMGQAPITYVTSWEYGWTVEVLTLIVALALSVAFSKVASVNPLLAKIFIVAAIILLLLNSWADFASSPGSNGLIRFLVALAIAIMVTVGLPLGLGLIEHGFEEYE
jgi:hypothetical protein